MMWYIRPGKGMKLLLLLQCKITPWWSCKNFFNIMKHWSWGMWISVWRPNRLLHVNAKKCITVVSHQYKNIFKHFILPLKCARLTLWHFTAAQLCRWLWTFTISNDWQYSVKKHKWPRGSNITSWTYSRNGNKGQWRSSCPSYSSKDLTSHKMEGCQPKIMWRGTKT